MFSANPSSRFAECSNHCSVLSVAPSVFLTNVRIDALVTYQSKRSGKTRVDVLQPSVEISHAQENH